MSLSHRSTKTKFGDLSYRTAHFDCPALHRGPFKNLPGMTVACTGLEEVEHHLKADARDGRYQVATPVNFCGDGKRFYLCYNEDCHSPPLFVVRADDEEEATDLLLENHPKTFEMSQEDVDERDKDGMPETVGYTGSGVPYDNEILNVRELVLKTVHFA